MCWRGSFDQPQGEHRTFPRPCRDESGMGHGWGMDLGPPKMHLKDFGARPRMGWLLLPLVLPSILVSFKNPTEQLNTLGRCIHPTSSQVYTPTQTELSQYILPLWWAEIWRNSGQGGWGGWVGEGKRFGKGFLPENFHFQHFRQ